MGLLVAVGVVVDERKEAWGLKLGQALYSVGPRLPCRISMQVFTVEDAVSPNQTARSTTGLWLNCFRHGHSNPDHKRRL
jgi:hypothetical protein